jgi:hypothetical protein
MNYEMELTKMNYEMSENNMTEMNKLAVLLAKNNIPFEIKAWNIQNKPTWQICTPSIADTKVDAVCHEFSYGHHDGLIEIMSAFEEDVVGWLTAEEALPYFQIF